MVVDASNDLERENLRLRRAVDELSLLNDIAREIGGVADPEEMIQIIIRRSLKAIPAEQGTVTLLNRLGPLSATTLAREMADDADSGKIHATRALLGWMLDNKRVVAVNDLTRDRRFGELDWDPATRSLLCAPMMAKSQLIGILTLYNDRTGRGFDEEDQSLLGIIASQSAQIIENVRLNEERTAMQHQVRLAADIQRHLLPESLPRADGYSLAGTSVAAQVVGGDYYDFIPMTGGRCAICLGDVSGKGLPAALVMANVQATIRLLTRLEVSPDRAMHEANELLVRCTPREKFVTFFFSILDPEHHELQYCNAGHNPPMLVRGGRVTRLRARGMVLGVVDGFAYETSTEQIEPNDLLVVFSDGVTEALDSRDTEFGEQRLADLLARHHEEPVPAIADAVMRVVREHAGDRPQNDDITLALLKRDA